MVNRIVKYCREVLTDTFSLSAPGIIQVQGIPVLSVRMRSEGLKIGIGFRARFNTTSNGQSRIKAMNRTYVAENRSKTSASKLVAYRTRTLRFSPFRIFPPKPMMIHYAPAHLGPVQWLSGSCKTFEKQREAEQLRASFPQCKMAVTDKNVKELGEWLEKEGFGESVVEIFTGKFDF
jgi:hypothetical protein